MTKEQFLKRCETIYEMGLADRDVLNLLSNWTDAIMRYEGGQINSFHEIMEKEYNRTHGFSGYETLANDALGYKVIQISAILSQPCQQCAENKNAWHTRTAFCKHKD